MAGGLNKVMLIGHLGADPEMRYTQSGSPVANIRLATSESWSDREGGKQERTEWHRVVAFGKLAELCNNYLRKGRQAYIEGRLQTRQWDDRDGNKRYTTEIVAREVVFLGGRGDGGSGTDSSGGGFTGSRDYGDTRDTAPAQDYGMPQDDDYPF